MKKRTRFYWALSLLAVFYSNASLSTQTVTINTYPTRAEVQYGTESQQIQLQYYAVNNGPAQMLMDYKFTLQGTAPSPNPITINSITDNCNGILPSQQDAGVCLITVNLTAVNTNTLSNPLNYQFSLMYGISPSQLSPATAPVVPIYFATGAAISEAQRTFTFVNNCSTNVWIGISGGGLQNLNPPLPFDPTNPDNDDCFHNTDCFPGSSCVGASGSTPGACFWNNPAPTNAVVDGGTVFELGTITSGANQNNTNTVIFPIYDNGFSASWSGGVTARVGCDDPSGNCKVGDCQGSGSGSAEDACVPSNGFAQPITTAEFTLQDISLIVDSNTPNGNTFVDTYDVTIINGITVPISMEPTNGVWGGASQPYTCGTPGNYVSNQDPLGACTWTFQPPNTDEDYYIWVEADPADTATCPGTCNVEGNVCGLTLDNVKTPNATLSCGTQLGYWTADAVCALGPDPRTSQDPTFGAPFNCGSSVVQDEKYYYRDIYGCGIGQFKQSCYSAGANSTCCGCQNWNGFLVNGSPVVVPTSPITQACNGISNAPCSGAACVSNYNWKNIALPQLGWMKLGCPTAYTYPYDDASSTFTCQTLQEINGQNMNVTDYTITFCPPPVAIKGTETQSKDDNLLSWLRKAATPFKF